MSKERIKQAQALLRAGKLEEAYDSFQTILEQDADNHEILHVCGIIQAQLGHFEKALQYINKAIKLDPEIAAYYNSKGNVFTKQGDVTNALKAYQKAIQFNPKYAPAYNNIGNCHHRQKKLIEAKTAYQTAIKLEPNYIDAHYNLGILLAQLGEHGSAIDELKKTILLNHNHASAYGQLAEIYLQEKKYKLAIENYQNRIQLQPNHVDSWFGYGQALMHEKRYDEAILAFEKVLMLDPKYPECTHNLGTAHLKSGDREKALNYYFRQLEAAPLIDSYFNIGVILMDKERNKDAINYFERCLALDPDYLPTHLNLGALYLKINKMQKAIMHYQEALRINPKDQEVAHILAAISQQKTPEAAPAEYLQHLFDQYATYYDQHLTEHLHYQVPEKIFNVIDQEYDLEQNKSDVLDLGCGTGLCGEYFHKTANRMVGIDISSQMIDAAKQKNIYDDLKVADIQDALDDYQNMNIILAADVFTYIGDLSSIFLKINKALQPGGIFAFSVEKTDADPYILQRTIRYAHSEKYLKSLIEKNAFEILRFENMVLRKQQNKPVEGYLIVLQKPNH